MFFFNLFNLNAQTFDYKAKWKAIDQESQKGAFKSNLEKVNEILHQARKDQNGDQLIKALCYQSHILIQTLEEKEEPELSIIQNFELEIQNQKGVNKQLLQFVLAQIYQQYFQSQSFLIRERTVLAEQTKDFREWTSRDFYNEISRLYSQSLSDPKALYASKLTDWDQILLPKEKSNLRPTLLDLITFAHKEWIENLGTWFDLQDHEKKQNDSLVKTQIQTLIGLHHSQGATSPLIYSTLSVIPHDLKHLSDFESVYSQYYSDPYASQILVEMAKIHLNASQSALESQHISHEKQAHLKQAHELCQKAISNHPQSPWTHNARELIKQIEWKWATVSIDHSPLADMPIPLLITHRNLDKVYIKVYDIPQTIDRFFDSRITVTESKQIAIDGKEVFSQAVQLRKFDDFVSHSTIFKLNPLPEGRYVVTISNQPTLKGDPKLDFINYAIFNVSDKVALRKNEHNDFDNNHLDLHLLDKKTGKPLSHSKWNLYKAQNHGAKLNKIAEIMADDQGFLPIAYSLAGIQPYQYSDNYLVLEHQETKALIDLNAVYLYKNSVTEPQKIITAQIFTDRAIYRPSQKVHFKAIVYTKDRDQAAIEKNKSVKVTLLDPNQKERGQISLTTNDFGSVFGELMIPNVGITGTYNLHLTSENGAFIASQSIQIEEYKRPKFEVVFDTLSNDYQLDTQVMVSGRGLAYSGVQIADAIVQYRVVRAEQFHYDHPWMPLHKRSGPNRFFYPWMRSSTPEEIVQGTSKTDVDGKFQIKFNTETPSDRENLPRCFSYTVYVTLTDLNGESQSGETVIEAGDVPLKLNIVAPKSIASDQWRSVTVKSTNLNNVTKPIKGSLKIYQLIEPNRWIKPHSIAAQADYQIYDEATFLKAFPHEAYTPNANDPQSWERKLVLERSFDNYQSDSIALPFKNLTPGHYAIEASTLYQKDTVLAIEYIQVFDATTQRVTRYELLSGRLDRDQYSLGQKARLSLNSGLANGTVYVSIYTHNAWIIKNKALTLVNGSTYLDFDITKAMQQGVEVSYYMVYQNAYAQQHIRAGVLPSQSYELSIQTKTFRNKLEPGVKEVWELTISGKDKDKLMAEVLATLYDASLDAFVPHQYSFEPRLYQPYWSLSTFDLHKLLERINYMNQVTRYPQFYAAQYKNDIFNYLNFYGFNLAEFGRVGSRFKAMAMSAVVMSEQFNDGVEMSQPNMAKSKSVNVPPPSTRSRKSNTDKDGLGDTVVNPTKKVQPNIRTNLQETAFFFPNLMTDDQGNVVIRFTTPEALTKWKLMLVAHTQDLKHTTLTQYVQTQKELMVVPNTPRFLREEDQITLSTKITNLSDKLLKTVAKIELLDALSLKPITSEWIKQPLFQNLDLEAGKNASVEWQLQVPRNTQAIVYRVVAQAGTFSDGEEHTLPVLPNRIMVTETLPLSVRENQTKSYVFGKLKQPKSNTLQSYNLTLELTTNPLWSVVSALPYLREYPYECTEQTFSRLYANALSAHIVRSSPKIKQVFDQWNQKGLQQSNLEKNQELKQMLIEETPWLREAQSETEQMQRIAILFDLNTMAQELDRAQKKLLDKQLPSGGFAWYGGDREDVYITNHIIGGLGKLRKMLGESYTTTLNQDLSELTNKAIAFSDKKVLEMWNQTPQKEKKLLEPLLLHFFYARSFWLDKQPLPAAYTAIQNKILNVKPLLSTQNQQDIGYRALFALVLHRYHRSREAKLLVNALDQTSVESDEMGKYWKQNTSGWLWYQAPIENQTLLIEAYDEITQDQMAVESMKVWLIKNKQANHWPSTKSTAEAVYALLSLGKSWIDAEQEITVQMGGQTVYPPMLSSTSDPSNIQASGYFKKSWKNESIQTQMGEIKIEKKSPGVLYGGLYWQYFENLNKITPAQTNLKLKKELYLKTITNNGPVLVPITENTPIQIGDLITVRCVIQTDRELSYLHLKDMRASGLEPINVLSGYKYKDGMGYYESTRDAATHFFIHTLSPGVYVFEYELRASHAGIFSGGISTIQNMYAPEFSAHTQGTTVKITH